MVPARDHFALFVRLARRTGRASGGAVEPVAESRLKGRAATMRLAKSVDQLKGMIECSILSL